MNFFLSGAGNRFTNRSITKRQNATPRSAPSCDVSPGNDSDTIYEKTRTLPPSQSLRSAKTLDFYQISSRSRQRVSIEPDLPPSPVMGQLNLRNSRTELRRRFYHIHLAVIRLFDGNSGQIVGRIFSCEGVSCARPIHRCPDEGTLVGREL